MQDAENKQSDPQIPQWFTALVDAMFLLYPAGSLKTGTTAAWWLHLRHLSQPILVDSFRRAVATNPVFPPSAQVIRDIGDAEIAEERKTERQREAEQRYAREARQLAAMSEPRGLKPDNPFLNLAHKWQYESLELGLDPERRMQELQELLGQHGPQDIEASA
jgi:hypothetical protein